ncbi:MAG: CopG family transcriptional regulator [Microbacteriaceae bacterium]
MKTAISLPDDIFERASRRANDLGMSRSEFFARAAGNYLDELDATSVTKQINVALTRIGKDESNDWAVDAGHRVLAQGTDEW